MNQRPLLVLIATLVGVIVGLIAFHLSRADQRSVSASVFAGGGAFSAAVTVTLLAMSAAGLLSE